MRRLQTQFIRRDAMSPGKPDDRRQEALTNAISQIEKEYGKGTVMRLGGAAGAVNIPCISTGSLAIDVALGGRGVPRGRVVEIYGPEGSGKTTLCLHIITNCQRAGGEAVFIDAEHAMDPAFAKKIGVDLDRLYISQPDSGEQALEIAETFVRSNAVDVVVVDSVAALVPRSELEGDMGDAQVGAQARLMSQALRKLTAAISRSRTCVIFTNQIREKIGIMFGNPETTPGGRALKFYASVRIEVRRVTSIKDTDKVIGNRVRATIQKNKVAPPYKRAEFEILFAQGISREGDVVDMGTDLEVIEKSGSWLSYKGEKIGQGREQAKEFLRAHKDVAAAIEKEIRRAAGVEPESHPPAAGHGAQAADDKKGEKPKVAR
jgi:recombination protein RecA